MSKTTQKMAEEMYQTMCGYVGSDHEGKCIEFIVFTLDSMESVIDKKQTLLKDIFSDITKDKRLSPDTFDRLVEVLK